MTSIFDAYDLENVNSNAPDVQEAITSRNDAIDAMFAKLFPMPAWQDWTNINGQHGAGPSDWQQQHTHTPLPEGIAGPTILGTKSSAQLSLPGKEPSLNAIGDLFPQYSASAHVHNGALPNTSEASQHVTYLAFVAPEPDEADSNHWRVPMRVREMLVDEPDAEKRSLIMQCECRI